MDNPYDVHSWSRLYREEKLREARARHLRSRLRASRDRPGRVTLLVAALVFPPIAFVAGFSEVSTPNALSSTEEQISTVRQHLPIALSSSQREANPANNKEKMAPTADRARFEVEAPE